MEPVETLWEMPRRANWVKITCVIPAEMFVVWDTVCSELSRKGVDHESEPVRNGFVLEYLCAEYLGGKR